ncbi:MAG: protease modulator HflC [Rudaea sp.]
MKLLTPVVAVLLALLIANSAFIVPEGQSALVLQFGRIVDAGNVADNYKPGLHFKFPLIQQVVRYDRRILNLEVAPERYFTSEKKAVNVDFYVKWQIDDPAAYYRSFGADDMQTLANQRLAPIIKDALRFEFTARTLNDLVASARSDITEHVLAQANQATASKLGIRVVDVRIKRIEFPDEVLASVYKRMSAERNRLANEQRSNGQEAAAKIEADADRQVQVIKAEAERDAQEARGEGDAKAAEIYASAYNRDPDFYAFYRSLQAYRGAFKHGGVLVLDPKSEFLRYFDESRSPAGKP